MEMATREDPHRWQNFKGYKPPDLRRVLKELGKFQPIGVKLKCLTATEGMKSLLMSPGAQEITLDWEFLGAVDYHLPPINFMSQYWNGKVKRKWKQFFWPLLISWGPEPGTRTHISFLYFERDEGNSGHRIIYFDSLMRNDLSCRVGAQIRPYDHKLWPVFSKIKAKLGYGFENTPVEFHNSYAVFHNMNMNIKGSATAFTISTILKLVGNKYSSDLVQGEDVAAFHADFNREIDRFEETLVRLKEEEERKPKRKRSQKKLEHQIISEQVPELRMAEEEPFVLCYNKGCGQQYKESQNTETSCRFHPGDHFFHDAYKGWSCCNRKTVDFTEFLNMKGCAYSFHSNVKPPEVEKKKELIDDILESSTPAHPVYQAMKRPPLDDPMIFPIWLIEPFGRPGAIVLYPILLPLIFFGLTFWA